MDCVKLMKKELFLTQALINREIRLTKLYSFIYKEIGILKARSLLNGSAQPKLIFVIKINLISKLRQD